MEADAPPEPAYRPQLTDRYLERITAHYRVILSAVAEAEAELYNANAAEPYSHAAYTKAEAKLKAAVAKALRSYTASATRRRVYDVGLDSGSMLDSITAYIEGGKF